MDQRVDNERRLETAPGREAKPAVGQARPDGPWLERLRARRRMVLILTALVIVAVAATVYWWVNSVAYESTDDAFIDARTVPVSAQISAAIVDVPVTDNQLVEAGAVLLRLDDRDYRAQVDQAKAQMSQAQASITSVEAQVAAQQARIEQAEKQTAQAQAALTFAKQEDDRYQRLVKTGAVTVEQAQQYTSNFLQVQASFAAAERNESATRMQLPVLQAQRTQAEAQVEQARAALEQAETNLSRTTITAPVAGRIARLTAAKGAYAAVGQALIMFVPREVWVTANFKETQLRSVPSRRPGDDQDRRLSRATSSKATSTASRRAAAPPSACCRRKTRPATTSRSSSACRSRSFSTSRPTSCSAPACRSSRPSGCDERSAAATAGGRESRSAAGDRNPWLIAIVVSIATFMVVLDTAIANVALRYIAGSLAVERRREHLGDHHLPRRQRCRSADQRLALQRDRAQALLHAVRCGLHRRLAAVRPAPAASARCCCSASCRGSAAAACRPASRRCSRIRFRRRSAPQAFALYGVAVIVAPTVGPTIGGWITDNYSWHWIFFINVPIGSFRSPWCSGWWWSREVLERERRERLADGLKIDWQGFVLVALSFGSLEVVLDRGQIEDWFHSSLHHRPSPTIALCSFLFFIPWELTHSDPIVDIRLLCRRQFGMAFLVMMAVGAILFGSTQITPQLMQTNFRLHRDAVRPRADAWAASPC